MPYKDKSRRLQCYREASKRKQKWLSGLKIGKSCLICGYDRHPAALLFHHPDPKNKVRDVADMRGMSKAKILKEVSKCQILCANCHAIIHSLMGDIS